MHLEIFKTGESVLLLGEGNFSFSIGLANLGLGLNLTSTCFESMLTETQIENINVLKSRGANVMTGIDATKVHSHELLKNQKFDKILFNFPHVGGKMKIHLNRELLRLFFLSASNLLVMPMGRVIVSLCRGQGADFEGKRVWADSWQVVDMAGHAKLLLEECSSFEWENFPVYRNVGYRSLEKGFHSEDAVVHVFSHDERFVSTHVDTIIDYYKHKTLTNYLCHPVYTRTVNLNILENEAAPIPFVLSYLRQKINPKCVSHKIEKCLFHPTQITEAVSNTFKFCNKTDLNGLMYSFYIPNKLGMDFTESPLTIQTYIFGAHIYDHFKKALSEFIMTYSREGYQIKEHVSSSESKVVKKVFLQACDNLDEILFAELIHGDECLHSIEQVLLVHIDILVMKMFSLTSWKQLWAKNINVILRSGKPFVRGICPYPVFYSFDISFTINSTFTEEIFYEVLWNTAGEIIEKVNKVSEFSSPNSSEQSLCYRLSYLSYDYPTCRKTLINFHHNILSRILENVLDVHVK